mmetsp:Transcript_46687/g.101495  ORF Transcript_46687/g.101495 Transcript_46687/m.101495 type:complete len:249 (-) Transcript_46687:702-1448(-)
MVTWPRSRRRARQRRLARSMRRAWTVQAPLVPWTPASSASTWPRMHPRLRRRQLLRRLRPQRPRAPHWRVLGQVLICSQSAKTPCLTWRSGVSYQLRSTRRCPLRPARIRWLMPCPWWLPTRISSRPRCVTRVPISRTRRQRPICRDRSSRLGSARSSLDRARHQQSRRRTSRRPRPPRRWRLPLPPRWRQPPPLWSPPTSPLRTPQHTRRCRSSGPSPCSSRPPLSCRPTTRPRHCPSTRWSWSPWR